MSTLATPIRRRRQLKDPACVKVVFDGRGRALYFSRSVIPCARHWDDALLTSDPPTFYQHVGLYAYRRDFLLATGRHAALDVGDGSKSSNSCGCLEAGYAILVGVVDEPTFGIDTPDDYQAFVEKSQGLR